MPLKNKKASSRKVVKGKGDTRFGNRIKMTKAKSVKPKRKKPRK